MSSENLGELEKKVMDIIWAREACSIRFVVENLPNKPAYTTVATIIQRLCDKKLITKQKTKSGFVYKSIVSKEEYTKKVANSFLTRFIGSFGDTAISSFADSVDQLPKEKKKYFLELLEQYEKNK